MKRYRCACCGCIHTLKPAGIPLFQHLCSSEIFLVLAKYVDTGCYDNYRYSRQRQRHWFRSLKKNIKYHLGFEWAGLLDGFSKLLEMGLNPISRTG